MRRQGRASRDDVKKGRFPSTSLLDAFFLDACVLLAVAACHSSGSTLTVSGTVEIRDIQLAALTSGRLQQLLKDEGDTVRRGDTVAVLTQPGLDALIGQRRAQARAAAFRVAEVQAAEADSASAADTAALAAADSLGAARIATRDELTIIAPEDG